MISYAAEAIFTEIELDVLEEASRLVYGIEGFDDLRCHELARAVGEVLGLPVQDGHFGIVDHTWLWLRKPDPKFGCAPNILDPYAIGSLPQVQLVDMSHLLPHNVNYRPEKERDDVKEDVVRRLVTEMRALQVTFSRHEDASQGLERSGRPGMAPLPEGPGLLSGQG